MIVRNTASLYQFMKTVFIAFSLVRRVIIFLVTVNIIPLSVRSQNLLNICNLTFTISGASNRNILFISSLRVFHLSGDRWLAPEVRHSAQPSVCVNVSLRSSSTHGGVGCSLIKYLSASVLATGSASQRRGFLPQSPAFGR